MFEYPILIFSVTNINCFLFNLNKNFTPKKIKKNLKSRIFFLNLNIEIFFIQIKAKNLEEMHII